ncbi:MAG: DNA repair protein RecO [Caldilineaceae bacterium]
MSKHERVYRTKAIVLSRRDHGEADRVLTLFTPALGKQEWIAKGIRKTTSRKAGHLELFTHATLLVAKARTWDIITEAATVENFRYLRENLESIAQASYLCELVSCFSEQDDENQPLWDLLLLAFRILDENAQKATEESATFLRWFELHLLELAGFQPQLFHCLRCNEQIKPVVNFLSLENGGIVCPRCAAGQDDVEAIDADVLKILRHLQRSTWPESRQVQIRPFLVLAAENILHRYILTVLERQLKSIQFLRKLQTSLPKLAPPPSDNGAGQLISTNRAIS